MWRRYHVVTRASYHPGEQPSGPDVSAISPPRCTTTMTATSTQHSVYLWPATCGASLWAGHMVFFDLHDYPQVYDPCDEQYQLAV